MDYKETRREYLKDRYKIPTWVITTILVASFLYALFFEEISYDSNFPTGYLIFLFAFVFWGYRYAHGEGYFEGYNLGYERGSEEKEKNMMEEIGFEKSSLLTQLEAAKKAVKKAKK